MKKKVTMQRVYKRSVTYRITNFIWMLVFVGLLVWLAFKADDVLREYQLSRPREQGQKVAQRWLSGQTDELYALDSALLSDADSREAYDAYVKEAFEGVKSTDVRMTKLSDERYSFTLKGKDGASVTYELLQSGKTRYKLPAWSLDRVESDLLRPQSFTVRAPASSTVTVNGVPLETATETNLDCSIGEGIYAGYDAMTEKQYEVTWYLSKPAVAVTDQKGREQSLEETGKDSFFAQYNYDDEAFSPYLNDCVTAVDTLVLYTVGIKNVYEMYKLTLNPSRAYDFISEYHKWESAHAGPGRTENLVCTHFIDLGQGEFGCEISGRSVCSYRTRDDTITDINYLMVFRITDGKAMLKDFFQN